MTKPKKLYIDSEGVERGYYVYLHRDRKTGEVFYYGKGSDRRAWNDSDRNDLWHKKVESLTEGWKVEIVKDDLSELEAFSLEAQLIYEDEGYGIGDAANTLTNLQPGGESGTITFGFKLPDDLSLWSAAYYDARTFREFPRDVQETMVKDLRSKLDKVISRLGDLQDEADLNDDEKLEDSVYPIEATLYSLSCESDDFLRRRRSWKDLALEVEDAIGVLDLEDIEEHHQRVRPLIKQAYKIATEFLNKIDSGNQKEAEKIADHAKSTKL